MAERNIIATLLRKNKVIWVRHYGKLDTAVPRAVQLAMRVGEPRDVVELSHAHTGLQLGTVKLHVNGKLTTDWIWD